MAETRLAIVDYGMGNLLSIRRACESAGFSVSVTRDPGGLRAAHAMILPGVGAFGFAMEELSRLGLAEALSEQVRAGKPLLGICLGMQLLLDGSEEFGAHGGLGFIRGGVRPLAEIKGPGLEKVPFIGWKKISPGATPWTEGLLKGVPDGAHMYFVHSFHAVPADDRLVLARTTFRNVSFCAAVSAGNVMGTQFHPEKSGEHGLTLFRNLLRMARAS